jgi:NAD(P)-dependent dehydrogenase (short-subunit alcohol dehydrogenase family)
MPALLVIGARHLGGTVADRFHSRGYGVATVSLTHETAERVRGRLAGAEAFTGDAGDESTLERVVGAVRERFGSLDVAVNAASPAARRGAFGGGPLLEAPAEAIRPYASELVPQVFTFLRVCGRAMVEQGHGTLIQVTGGSARRAIAGRGAWAAGAFATRALTQAAALELRERGVHVALLVVDATIESEKTRDAPAGGSSTASTTHDDVVDAIEYLARQSPRAWSHELVITPAGDRWVP